MKSITSITPTLCELLGISLPSLSAKDTLTTPIEEAHAKYGITKIDKCLFYTPDAIGKNLYRKYQSSFAPVLENTSVTQNLCSVFPPKTPVCYASMFTGALPQAHGIRQYEKPVLTCDTVFDALVRGGKKVALVAVADCSVDRIFRKRDIDYFSEVYDNEVTEQAIKLLRDDKHDFILAYHQEYDDSLHRTTPESPESIRSMNNHIKAFGKLAQAFNQYWNKYNRLIVFGPDHGAHIDPKSGQGTHGEDIPDDMNIVHSFGFAKAQ